MSARRSTGRVKMSDRQGRRKDKTVKASAPALQPEPALTEVEAEATPVAGEATGALLLAPLCTLREAVALKAQLLERLDQSGDVQIDGGGVEKIDTAGIQLLVAFSRQLGESHRTLAWTAVASELNRAAVQLGLAQTLGLTAAGVAS
jgi:phospholipid transport system transporter-binding protein